MKKATCLLISFLILATPLFALKEAIYNTDGNLIGYVEEVNGKIHLYNEYGTMVKRYDINGQEVDQYKELENALSPYAENLGIYIGQKAREGNMFYIALLVIPCVWFFWELGKCTASGECHL